MILFWTIFFFHCSWFLKGTFLYDNLFAGGGVQAVAYFFVLSGYVAALSEKNKVSSIKECFAIVKKRYIQFARYHMPFLIICLPLMIKSIIRETVFYMCCFLANVFLIQSWFIDEAIVLSFNGVAWFLSTSLFLCLLTPVLETIDKKLKSIHLRIGVIVLMFIGAVIITLCVHSNETVWLYSFPPTRIFDYACGFFCGKIFLANRNKTWSVYMATVIEGILCLLFVCLLVINIGLPENIRRFVIYMPTALMSVYVFGKNTGYISKLMSCKSMVKMGDKTLYYMVCHQIVLRYIYQIYKRLPWDGIFTKYVCVIIALIITLISEPVYQYIMKGLRNAKKYRDKKYRSI